MKRVKNLSILLTITLITANFAAAQTEADLESYFEGKRVEVKIDMPATKDGVTVSPEKSPAMDFSRYGKLLKTYGISLREGDRVMITKIKVKDKQIEFQLGGGGYGTFGDETGSSVYVPTLSKSQREKDLEKRIKDEPDDRRRRKMRDELDYLRRDRENENSRNQAEAATTEEIAKVRIQDKRLQAGSRFNIKFGRKLTPEDLTPEALMSALAEFVYFSGER